MYNILKTLNIKIKMVSYTFQNVGIMIDPKRKKSSCCFPGADVRGWGRGGGGGGGGGVGVKCTILGHLAFS